MLKRNGRNRENGFVGPELDSYQEALQTIQPEFDQLKQIKRQFRNFPQSEAEQHRNSLDGNSAINTGEITWQIQTRLLKLPKSEVLLCRRFTGHEFAIIQRIEEHAAYAKANGAVEILATGTDARRLVSTYSEEVRHTLRFMASNLVAKAQKVVWERFPRHNPAQVVRAISERCSRAVAHVETIGQGQHRRHGLGV